MNVILPLTIAILVSGVYCPRGELPMWYPLKNLKSNCAYVDFKSSGCKYEFSCKENVLCSLIERFELGNNEHCFKKAHVEFIAMENEKTTLTMCMYPNEDVKWNITCDFSNPDQARQFHKLITKDRLSELVRYLKAKYLKTSDNKMMAENPYLYFDGFERNITIVVKNDKDEAVLIIPRDAISKVTLRESTNVDLLTTITRGREVLYKFGFSTPEHASAWNEVLNKLSQPFQTASLQAYRRPYRDPTIDQFFKEIQREIPR